MIVGVAVSIKVCEVSLVEVAMRVDDSSRNVEGLVVVAARFSLR